MPDPLPLIDRLEAVRTWLLRDRVEAKFGCFSTRVSQIDDHLATLDDAIEALHPVHGE